MALARPDPLCHGARWGQAEEGREPWSCGGSGMGAPAWGGLRGALGCPELWGAVGCQGLWDAVGCPGLWDAAGYGVSWAMGCCGVP